MERNSQQPIQQLVGKEQLEQASSMGVTIVQVSFDNDYDPIFLASKEMLSNDEYMAFVKSKGLDAENYRIITWNKE